MDNEVYMDDEDASMGSQYDYHLIDDLYEGEVSGDIDIADIIVNANHARQFQGVDPTKLSKICIIDLDYAKRTLDVITHTSVWSQDPNLIRNYGTNDFMIRGRTDKTRNLKKCRFFFLLSGTIQCSLHLYNVLLLLFFSHLKCPGFSVKAEIFAISALSSSFY